jgi:anti-sigma factor RsiW
MTKTPCKEYADRIVDYVDGELPPDEAQAVARHLVECDRCRQTAEGLQRSLGLARVLWRDNLADTTAVRSDAVRRLPRCPHGHTTNLSRRRVMYALATAASIILATGISLFLFLRQAAPQPVSLEEIERQVARAGRAAELLAATRIVTQCEGTESIVQQQYRYILREYADTPAAESIKANHDVKLGGIYND